ncbi:hypothetical protein L3Q82_008783, partial [Scortum barcoo]
MHIYVCVQGEQVDRGCSLHCTSDNDETHYREEIPAPYSVVLEQQPCSEHQQDQGGHSGLQEVQEHAPLLSHREAVERVNNIKFLGIHITSDLTWSMNTAHL